MASSALSGDRRLGSGRRGGMTVLGKVAVPKPINLPSQRLENHGLDPNVEIVPKGTLSWGSRTPTTSNAWGSTTLSPRTDGGTLSPSSLSARPSSGESGTRPSTGGSDRAHDPSTTARGSNSRPSSASGANTSSQTSIVSLRPRSAETRPGSSQLSRFAEPSAEPSVGGVLERLGMTSSRNDGFSLSSGDFPVLGSEKSESGKCAGSQEHHSQGSGSPPSVATRGREGFSSSDNKGKNGVLNSWRREEAIFGEDGVRSGIDQWHGNSPSFPNSGMRPSPQHFNAWRGPVVNSHPPGSGWYRGPPGGPYGGPVAPSGFPMEPFPYYQPQAAPPVLPNPPSAAPSGTGPRGHHPNNGEFCRPPIPGAFVRPNMPVRPGFYPSALPYDAYFGPQLRYRSPTERDIAFAGMAPGVPYPYYRYPASENGNSNARSAGFDNKISSSELAELGHLHDSGGQYKVLLKQHDSWDEEGEEDQQGETKAGSELPPNLGSQSKTVNSENDRKLVQIHGIDENSEIGDPKDYKKSDDRANSSDPWRVNLPESVPGHANDVDLARKSKQQHSAPEVSQSLSAAAKDSSLIQKIESLNAKSRASDICSNTLSASDRHNQDAISQRPLLPHPATEIKNLARVDKKNQDAQNFQPERSGQIFYGSDKIHERTAVGGAILSRAYPHGGQRRAQHRGGIVGSLNADEWHKNPIAMNSVVPSVETSNILPNNEVGDYLVSHPLENEGENKPVTTDSSDSPAERARLKELAKQRARRRQEEEEERARDQKARALAKLEELNKRRQLEESLNCQAESISSSGTASKSEQQGLHPLSGKGKDSTIVLSHETISKASPVSQIDERVSGVEGSTILSGDAVSIRSPTSRLQRDTKSAGVIDHNPENMSYKHSSVVSKEKPNRVSGEPAKLNDRTAYVAKSGDSVLDDINPSTEESYLSNPQNVVETIVHQRRKGSKTSRTKQRVDNLSPASPSITAVNEASRASTPEENGMFKSLKTDLESNFIQQLPDSKDLKLSMEQHLLAPSTETAQTRLGFHGRSQNPRRTSRNQQINKLSEKLHGSDTVMWAPRSQYKIEGAVETDDGVPTEEANSSLKNGVSQNSAKYKRTEMERYIPKPVAKEMAQQGCVLQAVPLNNKSSQTETVLGVSSVSIENVQSREPEQGKEPRNMDGGQNMPGGAVGPWRQRSPKEAITEVEPRLVESGKDDPIRSLDQLAKEARMRYVKSKQKFQGHDASGDGPNPSFDSDPNAEVTRDHGSIARVKRSNYRATGTGVDIKQKKGSEFAGKSHNQSSVFDQQQRVPAVVSKESHGFVDRSTSQWQPKAPRVCTDDPQGSRPSGGKTVEVEGAGIDLEEPPKADATPIARSPQKAPSDASATGHNVTFSFRTDYANEGGRPDFNVKRERRTPQNRRLSKQQESGGLAGDEVQQYESEMHMESFENQNSRYGRGSSDSRTEWNPRGRPDWNPRGHYGKQQQNPPSNRERKHPNSHYRYQPVGKEDISKTGYFDGSIDTPSQKGVGQKNSGHDGDGVPV